MRLDEIQRVLDSGKYAITITILLTKKEKLPKDNRVPLPTIATQVLRGTSFSIHLLQSKVRTSPVVHVRDRFIGAAEAAGYSSGEVATFLRRTRSSIYKYHRRVHSGEGREQPQPQPTRSSSPTH